MFLVLLVINPIILHQAARVAVGGVSAVHVPGAASNQSYYLLSCIRQHVLMWVV
jgi:hypothetical protein